MCHHALDQSKAAETAYAREGSSPDRDALRSPKVVNQITAFVAHLQDTGQLPVSDSPHRLRSRELSGQLLHVDAQREVSRPRLLDIDRTLDYRHAEPRGYGAGGEVVALDRAARSLNRDTEAPAERYEREAGDRATTAPVRRVRHLRLV